MIRTSEQLPVSFEEHLKGGQGTVELRHLLTTAELNNSGRLFAISILPPGTSIGYHQHSGDFEVYFFLKGSGRLVINGEIFDVGPGDMSCCSDGESHSLENTGDTNLEYVAVILYTPEKSNS